MVGRALINAIIESRDEAHLSLLRPEFFTDDERPAYEFLVRHVERHGRLPSRSAFASAGLSLVEAPDSVSYYLDGVRRRAIKLIWEEERSALVSAHNQGDPDAMARIISRTNERVQRVNVDTSGRYRLRSLRDLLDDPPDAPRWIVPGLVPEGLTLLAGKPKAGKSYLVLDWCLAVAGGGDTLDMAECDPGDVLYVCLEGGAPLLHERVVQIGGRRAQNRFEFTTEFPPLHDGGLLRLREWLRQRDEQCMVVIDTFAHVRKPRHTYSYWDDAHDLGPLRDLAYNHHAAMVVVHHCRKTGAQDPWDVISGTTGLSGTADKLVVLRRDANDNDLAFLRVGGRVGEPRDVALRWSGETHRFVAIGETGDYDGRADSQRRVLEVVDRAAGTEDQVMTPQQIADATGLRLGTVNQALHRLRRDDMVIRQARGRYRSVRSHVRLLDLGEDDEGATPPPRVRCRPLQVGSRRRVV